MLLAWRVRRYPPLLIPLRRGFGGQELRRTEGRFIDMLRALRRFAATYAKASAAKLALLAGFTLLSVSHRFNRAGFDLFWSVGL